MKERIDLAKVAEKLEVGKGRRQLRTGRGSMGKKSRAERRHNHERMLNRVKGFHWLKEKFWHGTESERDMHMRKMAETRHPCSCHMCGNPRKHWKDTTMQEKRFEEYDIE